MRFRGRVYRAHDPKWSFDPLSGAGAAITGGRFNRKGEAVLYTALDIVTAVGECAQGFANRVPPMLICEYEVDCAPVADLATPAARAAAGIDRAALGCAWLTAMLAGREAPSWQVADRMRSEGFAGMLVPSFAPGADDSRINLVLWRWGDDLPTRIAVFDPEARLPRDQASWSAGSTRS